MQKVIQALYDYAFETLDKGHNGDEVLTNEEYIVFGDIMNQFEETGLVKTKVVNVYANIYGDF